MVNTRVSVLEKSLTVPFRVEKYRPDTLDDVSGHQDILVTINKFVESNVGGDRSASSSLAKQYSVATSSSPTLWPPRNRQDVDNSGIGEEDLWEQKHAANGP